MFSRIYIYWWTLNQTDGKDNYGDILAPFIVSRISNKKVRRVSHPMKKIYRFFIKHYVTVGSVICSVSKKSIVWGSGIIKENENVREATFLAVRGPRTRKRLIELGYEVPEVYGDPALLLPNFIINNVTKKHKLGIIPHYVDYDKISIKFKGNNEVKIIDLMTNDIVKTTKEILECETIISSSLHGIIVAHTYNIPALWIKFSNKLAGDNIKFYDYFESVDIDYKNEILIDSDQISIDKFEELLISNSEIVLPNESKLNFRKEQLLQSCPFKNAKR